MRSMKNEKPGSRLQGRRRPDSFVHIEAKPIHETGTDSVYIGFPGVMLSDDVLPVGNKIRLIAPDI